MTRPARFNEMPYYQPIACTLEAFECKTAEGLGNARQDNAELIDAESEKCDESRSNREIHIDGAFAEVVFAKTFNLYPDMRVVRLEPWDAVLKSGLRVNVKNSKYSNGALVVKASEKFKRLKPHAYSLVTGEPPHFLVWGFCKASVILTPEHWADWLPVPGYAMSRAELYDPRLMDLPDIKEIQKLIDVRRMEVTV